MLSLAFVLTLSAVPSPAPPLLPEIALCLQSFRGGERERAQAALGPLEALPLYRVEIEADPDERNVRGRVELQQWVGNAPVREVFLQLTPNAQQEKRIRLSNVSVNGAPAEPERLNASQVRIPVQPPAPPHSLLRLTASFAARVPVIRENPLGGLTTANTKSAPTDYGAFGASGSFLSLVGLIPRAPPLRPDGSPRDGPSGTGDLALYDPAHLMLTVKVPAGYEVWANGVELADVPNEKGGVLHTYAAAAVRDFPLFVSKGYRTLERQTGDVTLSVHFSPANSEAASRVLEYTVASVAEMEKRLGKLPFTRFRVVEAPLQAGAGGMEFPGLITVSSLLASGGMSIFDSLGIPEEQLAGMKELLTATSSFQQIIENTLEFTVAHEVAHQYFAGLVGSDPILEPYTDETLAQYTALLYLEWRYDKGASQAMRNNQLAGSYQLYRMMGGEDGPVARPTGSFKSGLQYAALVYGKGPLLHEAERKLLGDATFMKGLRRYVDTYRFKWACADCLTRVLAQESPAHADELKRLRRHWWLEAHGDQDVGSMDALINALQGQPLDPSIKAMSDEMMKMFDP